MRLNSKLTWGLAWTGLAVVLAVPSADFLTGRLGGDNATAVLTSDIEPVKTAAIEPSAVTAPVKKVTTIKTKNGVTIVPAGGTLPSANPVDKMLGSGKPLPDYITGGDEPAKPDTQVASLPQPVGAPTPFPSWARPKGAPALVMPESAATLTRTEPTPLIVDERTLTGSIAEPVPVVPSPMVDDSANWDEETLRQYLERRGILEGGGERSTATVTEYDTNYDPDGFYLSEGPNSDRTTRETRRQRILRMLEEEDPDSFTLF
jgi:hypothetical protein